MRQRHQSLVRGGAVKRLGPVEWREDSSRTTPGMLIGTIMTYGERAADRPERFEAGALYWPDAGVVLREQHNRQAPIARFTPTVEGLEVRAKIPLPDTQRGRDAGTMVRNGTLTGMSAEFVAEQEHRAAGIRVITRAALVGVGLVDTPSYSTSKVAVRHRAGGRRRIWL